MALEVDLTDALIERYMRAGQEVGYWGTRFLQAVRRNGGRAAAKRVMKPRNSGQRKGLDAVLDAGGPDLTVEAIIPQPRFRELFTEAELATAKDRLGEYVKAIELRRASRERLYPDELEPGLKYVGGARRTPR